MATKKPRSTRISLAPLTPEQALAGLLKVKPDDLRKLERDEEVEPTPKPPRKGPLRKFINADYATKKGRK